MSDDFDFKQMISLTETIINSGKYDELSALSVELHKVITEKNEWQATVFASLHYRNGLEFEKLNGTLNGGGDDLADIAWHTRNLLELCVWVMYCCQSKENAHTFYGDAARDGHDILSTFQKWSSTTGLYPQDENTYNAALNRLEQSATRKNVSDIDESYQRVHEIAKTVGLEHHFSTLNKALSKFIHPTAYSIIGHWDGPTNQHLKNAFHGQACVMFIQNFNLLEDAIKTLYQSST